MLIHPGAYILNQYRRENVKSSNLLLSTIPLVYLNNYRYEGLSESNASYLFPWKLQ